MISAIETANYYDHSLCIFDCYVGCTGLKRLSVCALRGSMSNALMHLKSIWVHWLNRAAGLVAEVQSPFVRPLWGAFDTAIKSESFPIGINNLEATQASVCHKIFSWTFLDPKHGLHRF
jgi:hypothetical protein